VILKFNFLRLYLLNRMYEKNQLFLLIFYAYWPHDLFVDYLIIEIFFYLPTTNKLFIFTLTVFFLSLKRRDIESSVTLLFFCDDGDTITSIFSSLSMSIEKWRCFFCWYECGGWMSGRKATKNKVLCTNLCFSILIYDWNIWSIFWSGYKVYYSIVMQIMLIDWFMNTLIMICQLNEENCMFRIY
jgi:hypothetical protein